MAIPAEGDRASPAMARALAGVGDFHRVITPAANRCFEIVIGGFFLEPE
jgi:hypothetical protein